MGNFQRGGSRGGYKGGEKGGKSFSKKSWGGDRGARNGDIGEVTMHKATCSDCGNTCEVPFRPTGDKPVFCNECFGGKRDGGRDNARGGRDFGSRPQSRPDYKASKSYIAPVNDDSKKLLGEIADKLDRLFIMVERITEIRSKEVSVETPVKVSPTIVPKVIVKKSASKEVVKSAIPKKVATKKVTVKKVSKKKTK